MDLLSGVFGRSSGKTIEGVVLETKGMHLCHDHLHDVSLHIVADRRNPLDVILSTI